VSFGHLASLDLWVPGQSGRRIECHPDRAHLALSATCRHTDASGDDQADVRALRLSPSTIGLLSEPGVRCRIQGGYADVGSYVTVFEGPVIPESVKPATSTADGVTTWQVSAGGLDLQRATVSRSWSDCTAADVLRFVAAEAALRPSIDRRVAVATYVLGYTASGTALRVVQRVCRDIGAAYRVESGTLYVYPADAAPVTDAPRLTPSTGLLGSPSRGTDGTVEASATLLPSLRPGGVVVIEGEQVRGAFRVTACEHLVSSTDAGAHRTNLTGRPL